MKVLVFPHPKLLVKCRPVTVFGPELKVLLDSMYKVMVEESGIGLAANQVGLEFRMFTMQSRDGTQLNLVNPEIVWSSRVPAPIREGCLSAPNTFVVLNRPSIVKIKFQDELGTEHTKMFNDIHAVCAQHEIDHLDGKSFLEHKSLTKAKKQELARKWGLK